MFTFLADLVAIWWGRGRVTELLFGIERGGPEGDCHVWMLLKFLLEQLIAERAEIILQRFWCRFNPPIAVRRLADVADAACKLLYCTGDSPFYGLAKTLLRIPYHQQQQSRPNEALRWALFWGQAVITILNQATKVTTPTLSFATTSASPTLLPSSPSPSSLAQWHKVKGKCPGCLQSLAEKDRLFMLPEKGIAHCSVACLGRAVDSEHSKPMTIHV